MNDKDKVAFDIWIGIDKLYDPWRIKLAEMSWQAACEYKQKEIDELKDQIDHQDSLIFELDQNVQVFMEKSKALQAENAKLRECVEFYADRTNWSFDDVINESVHHGRGGKRARQVLKELDEE